MDKKIIMGSLIMAGCLALSISTIAYSDDDDFGGGEGERSVYGRTSDVALVTNKAYASECGSCHFAYQPGWLPERSWKKLMGSLDNHFGENAELDDATRTEITNYLVGHAADVIPNRMSSRIMASVGPDEAPLRISELRFMQREHREISRKMIEENAKVGSRSNCQACHTQAAGGYFNEHGINIPGFGRFED